MNRRIRLVVADDHPGMLEIVRTLLSETFCVVAAVSSGDALIQAAVELWPDVIVSDVDMPVHDGLEAMLKLRTLGLQIPFVLLGIETAGAAHLLSQGATAYVHKYDIYADLIDAVLLATTGKKFVSRSIAERMN